ncbi:MAG: response regulator [Pseudomonadota bacterium]
MITTDSVGTPQAVHQTTKARCRIFHIGLDTRETLVIDSVFRMTPELGAHFVFGAPEGADTADVLFIDGDNPSALAEWEQVHRGNPGAVGIIVTAGESDFDGQRTLHRPLSFRNFQTILDAITCTGPASGMAAAGSDHLRVLVVDDSFPARQFMKFKLEELAGSHLHLQVDFADSGEKALACVREHAYDLVFLDVEMPGMDGYQTCARIKALKPVRVAMLTSRAAPVDFTRGHDAGCDNYMPKPPNDIDLRTLLRLTSLKKLTHAG